MSEPRVIKKYPNRRLYDTAESRYITLADVRRHVLDRVEFVVIDKRSQEDITRAILLQVIAEQEDGGEPVLSRDFLAQVIRSHGGAMHALIGTYLEQSLKLFASQPATPRDRAKTAGASDALDAGAALAQKNHQRWRAVQEEIFRALVNAGNRARGESGRGDGGDD